MPNTPEDPKTIDSIRALLPHLQAIEQACRNDPTRQLATFGVFLYGALERHANHYDELTDPKARQQGLEAFKYLFAGIHQMVQVAMQEWPASAEQTQQAGRLMAELVNRISWLFGTKFIDNEDELDAALDIPPTLPH